MARCSAVVSLHDHVTGATKRGSRVALVVRLERPSSRLAAREAIAGGHFAGGGELDGIAVVCADDGGECQWVVGAGETDVEATGPTGTRTNRIFRKRLEDAADPFVQFTQRVFFGGQAAKGQHGCFEGDFTCGLE
jgi:hypothetical protein